MEPNLKIVSKVQVDWLPLRENVLKGTGLQPSLTIAQCPVKISSAAEYLLFAAYLYLDDYSLEPRNLLLNLPRECMEFLHYSFLIECEPLLLDDLREKTNAHYASIDMGKYYCILGTGSLAVWYDAIILNLEYPSINWKSPRGLRVLLNKMLLLFEKEGLYSVFAKYVKNQMKDGTFLLEK